MSSLSLYSPALIKKVSAAFDIFDSDHNGTVDVREVGTILRSIGLYPSEAQLHTIILELQHDEPSMFVNRTSFLPVCCRLVANNEITGPTPEDLASAFSVLDPNNTGFLEVDQLRVYLSTAAERLSADEVENFIAFATDAETGLVDWRSYVTAVMDILWTNDE